MPLQTCVRGAHMLADFFFSRYDGDGEMQRSLEVVRERTDDEKTNKKKNANKEQPASRRTGAERRRRRRAHDERVAAEEAAATAAAAAAAAAATLEVRDADRASLLQPASCCARVLSSPFFFAVVSPRRTSDIVE